MPPAHTSHDPNPNPRDHAFESPLLVGLANFANLQDKLCQIVNINTPWGDLAQPQTPAAEAGAEGVGGEGAGRARRVGPLLSKTATRGAAAKDAAAAAAAAEAAKANPPPDTADAAPPRPKSAARPPRPSKTPAGEEADGGPSRKKQAPSGCAPRMSASGAPRMSASAASVLQAELAELRARTSLP